MCVMASPLGRLCGMVIWQVVLEKSATITFMHTREEHPNQLTNTHCLWGFLWTWYCYSFIHWCHTGHRSYLGFLYVEHTHNNPIVHVFVSLMSGFQSGQPSEYRAAERRSLAYGVMQPDIETALLVSTKASSNCGWSAWCGGRCVYIVLQLIMLWVAGYVHVY